MLLRSDWELRKENKKTIKISLVFKLFQDLILLLELDELIKRFSPLFFPPMSSSVQPVRAEE